MVQPAAIYIREGADWYKLSAQRAFSKVTIILNKPTGIRETRGLVQMVHYKRMKLIKLLLGARKIPKRTRNKIFNDTELKPRDKLWE